uniref:Gfo/Idh/MocA-like oxidoreductase N-terminal domain-containing protein n=1 Tax=Dunaliella tertiolecta TaxID=3047 RepID=A0A7S3QUH3_DUNTE|mmetsp:Transcript_4316/g.10023  ORF Transcript_4316/g.10023 Transcript_4316/m.10023 type:complete len:377 (-) Transcript_4316:993-2123(-)
MAPQLRIGVLGAAGIARKNVRAIGIASDALCVVAVGSRSFDKAKSFISNNGLEGKARAYGSYQEVLDCSDVDAVYIPLPTSMHVEWVRKAAAARKHVLLEKPIAMNAADMEAIVSCMQQARLVLMDGTMWSHNPRAREMAKALADLGPCHDVKAVFTMRGHAEFMAHNIRTKPDLDGLGSLGDLGWYCVRASLWAFDFELPYEVVAHAGYVLNDNGVVMDGGATLLFGPAKGTGQPRHANIFHSFQQAMCQDLMVTGPKGTLRLDDFVIPHNEKQSAWTVTNVDGFGLTELADGTTVKMMPNKVDLTEPQEVLMWRDFAACVHADAAVQRVVRHPTLTNGSSDTTSAWWVKVAQDTQRVVHAIAESMKQGCKPVRL